MITQKTQKSKNKNIKDVPLIKRERERYGRKGNIKSYIFTSALIFLSYV